MSEDSSRDGSDKIRLALVDVTNRPGKRPFSIISGNRAVKSGDGSGKYVNDKEGDLLFAKQVCLGVENLVKEKCSSICVENDGENGLLLLKGKQNSSSGVDSQKENIIPVSSNISNETKEPSNLQSGDVHVIKGDTVVQSVLEVGDGSRDSCVSSVLKPTGSGQFDGTSHDVDLSSQENAVKVSGLTHSDLVREASTTDVCRNNAKHLDIANLASSNSGSIESSTLAKPLGSKFFELETCTGLKADGSSGTNGGVDLLKTCSCTFCLKASYILSDLHYQDIKGRIAALKRSQKDASILLQRSCKDKEIYTYGHGNPNKSTKLESDLMGQWRSLFMNMEDIFGRESSQLQASYVTLKDMRENCKTNLEMINKTPSEQQ